MRFLDNLISVAYEYEYGIKEMSKSERSHIQFEVLENYAGYKEIVDEIKRLDEFDLPLVQDHNRANRRVGNFRLHHVKLTRDMRLSVEGSETDGRKFKFKLFDAVFMNGPCFRFDSWGHAHMNFTDDTLLRRYVDTPHFHRYNQDGVLMAYRTDLIEKSADDLLQDRDIALAHFMKEGHISAQRHVHIRNDDLFQPTDSVSDPLNGVRFDE